MSQLPLLRPDWPQPTARDGRAAACRMYRTIHPTRQECWAASALLYGMAFADRHYPATRDMPGRGGRA